MSSHGHVLVFPFPAQGHVNSLMSLSMKLHESGFKVTFVNTDFNHKRVAKSMINIDELHVKLVSIPDGLEPDDDRNDLVKLCLGISTTMPSELEKLIENINNNGSDDEDSGRITGLVCDLSMAWSLEVADKFGIKGAIFVPTSAAILALKLHMPKLIDDGIMGSDGLPIIKGEFEISPDMPKMNTSQIGWCSIGDITSQKTIYKYIKRYVDPLVLTDWWLCNTTFELEPGALSLYPKILPIGPIILENHTNNKSTRSLGQFWEEDLSCLSWLDQQPPCSVIYIAFGSFTIFDQTQFTELALGLELTGRPFLWVVREDYHKDDNDANIRSSKMAYPNGFEGKKGKIVKWAPQQKVLSHPAIACFISHCGWNSTMEGAYNGVPFLCWPYFVDQFYDKSYVCDDWKVGLGFEYDENGRIVREEIKKKVEMVLGDEEIRARSVKLKEIVRNNVAKGGRSLGNYLKFVEWLQE